MNWPVIYKLTRYTAAGFFTTVVGFISFWFLIGSLNVEANPANAASIFLAVFFAYIVNKNFVFKSKCSSLNALVKEAARFFLSRGAAILLELAGLFLFYSVLNFGPLVSKIAISVFVLLFNYLSAQYLIFKKSEVI